MLAALARCDPRLFRFFFYWSGNHRDLHSFPTRRSSDLIDIPFTGAAAYHANGALRIGERLDVHFISRSEEHTSELQSHSDLVCRLLLEKKNDAGRLQHHVSIRTHSVHLSQTNASSTDP